MFRFPYVPLKSTILFSVGGSRWQRQQLGIECLGHQHNERKTKEVSYSTLVFYPGHAMLQIMTQLLTNFCHGSHGSLGYSIIQAKPFHPLVYLFTHPSFLLSSAIDHLSFPHSLYLSYIYVCVNIFKEEKLVGLNKFDHSKCSFVLYLWCQGILYELINRSLVRCTLKDSKDILGLQELLMWTMHWESKS